MEKAWDRCSHSNRHRTDISIPKEEMSDKSQINPKPSKANSIRP